MTLHLDLAHACRHSPPESAKQLLQQLSTLHSPPYDYELNLCLTQACEYGNLPTVEYFQPIPQLNWHECMIKACQGGQVSVLEKLPPIDWATCLSEAFYHGKMKPVEQMLNGDKPIGLSYLR